MGQTWKEFCASINKVANKAAVKIEEFSDTATLHVKAKSLDVKLCEAYERLGRLYYEQLSGEVGKAADIDREVAEIDRLKKELDEINAQLDPNKYVGRSANQVTEFLRDVVDPILARYNTADVKSELNL